jgi:transcriptional regulator with XRE-family HTH domain
MKRPAASLQRSRSQLSPAGPAVRSQTYSDVGADIREARKARGLTLQQLSSATNLSVGHLSEIERGLASPSVIALHDIAGAIGITVGWLFRNDEGTDPNERGIVVRANNRRSLVYESGIKDQLLSPHLRGQLEMLLSRFPAGTGSGPSPYVHRGEEAGIVMQGTLKLWVGEHSFTLQEGDSFSFPSTTPHRYENTGTEEAVVIWAITPPTF